MAGTAWISAGLWWHYEIGAALLIAALFKISVNGLVLNLKV